MEVIRFDDVNAFYARVESYLLPHEATHNLTFGLLQTIQHDPGRFMMATFALVEHDNAVQLVAVRTSPDRAIVLSLAAVPQVAVPLAVTALANALYTGGMALIGVNAPDEESSAFAKAWAQLSGITYDLNVPLRAFKLEKVNPVVGVPGDLRRAAQSDRDLIVRWEMEFRREAFPDQEHKQDEVERAVELRLKPGTGGIYLWDDGGVVSYTGYGGPTPNGIRIGPVYTPPELRGRGYASACVAGVSQALLDSGRTFCFLFTDKRNPTSNHIYQVIGYEPVCDFTEYMFK